MAKRKPQHTIVSHSFGLRERFAPAVEQKIADYARGATSPLGGRAVKAVPLAAALKQPRKGR
jgi:hypothetical protein